MKFEQLKEGEWSEMLMENQKLACCDCGLVHTINFKIKKKTVHAQFFRDEKATKKERKKINKKTKN